MPIYFQTKCRTRYSFAINLLYFNLLNLRNSYFIPIDSKMVYSIHHSPMVEVFKVYLRYNITLYWQGLTKGAKNDYIDLMLEKQERP